MSKHSMPKNALKVPRTDESIIYSAGINNRKEYLDWIELNGIGYLQGVLTSIRVREHGNIACLEEDLKQHDNNQDHDGYAYAWLKETFWKLGESKHFLDVGCNVGHLCHAIRRAKLFETVSGIDLAMVLVGFAKGLSAKFSIRDIDFRHGDALDMQYEDKKFDVVFSSHVLEHLPSIYLALKEQARVSKIVTGFAPLNEHTSNREHLYIFTEESLGKVMDKVFNKWEVKVFENKVIAYGGTNE